MNSHVTNTAVRKNNGWDYQKGRCFWCKADVPSDQKTIDHLLPRSKGGKSTNDNLVMACGACNANRGNSLVLEVDVIRNRTYFRMLNKSTSVEMFDILNGGRNSLYVGEFRPKVLRKT